MGGLGRRGMDLAELFFQAVRHPVEPVDNAVLGEIDEASRHMEHFGDLAHGAALHDAQIENLVMPGIGFGPDLVERQLPEVCPPALVPLGFEFLGGEDGRFLGEWDAIQGDGGNHARHPGAELVDDAGPGDATEQGPERTAFPGGIEPGQDTGQRDEGFLGGVGGFLVGQAGGAGAGVDQFPVQIDEGFPGQFPAALAESGEERGVGHT